MEYQKLLLLFHQDENKCNALYDVLYNSPLARHIDIPIKQLDARRDFPAFFYYTGDMVKLLADIMENLVALAETEKKIPGVAIEHFKRSCLIEEIQSSNDIEGVQSTRKEINLAIDEQANVNNAANIRLWSIVNKYIKLQKNENIAFGSSDDLRQFYDSFILDEVVKDDPRNKPDGLLFRRDTVDVWSKTKIIHHGIFPEAKIIEYMDRALQILHDEQIAGLVRVSLFHYLFGYIHPFYDGNGRTSRFITSYYLARILNPLVAIRLSTTLKKSLRTYYKLFQDTNAYGNRGDLTPFVTGFLWFILKSIIRVNELLAEKLNKLKHYEEKVNSLNIGDKTDRKIYYILLQASLFAEDGATLNDISVAVQKNAKTIREHINNLPTDHVIIDKTHRAHAFKLNLSAIDHVREGEI